MNQTTTRKTESPSCHGCLPSCIDPTDGHHIHNQLPYPYLAQSPTRSLDQLTSKIKQDLVRGVTASWKVWPLVHVINFRFIPPQQRLLYINSIQVRLASFACAACVRSPALLYDG
jgi:hypothetical protein